MLAYLQVRSSSRNCGAFGQVRSLFGLSMYSEKAPEGIVNSWAPSAIVLEKLIFCVLTQRMGGK